MFIMLLAVLLLDACNSSGGGGDSPPTNNYSVGGTVSGLIGSGLVLVNNSNELPISGNGTFSFGTKLSSGAAYNVTVKTQPTSPAQTCTPDSNSGIILTADITTISVICTTDTNTIPPPGNTPAAPVKLVTSDATRFFGYSVSLASDGNTIVSGASQSDAAYVYKWNGTNWAETKLMASDSPGTNNFGVSVSASSDGTTIVSGATGTEAVYVYQWNGSTWGETKLKASDGAGGDAFGVSVSVASMVKAIVVGASFKNIEQGSGYVYKWNGSSWDETKLTASDGASYDHFGESVSFSALGDVVVVGAPGDYSWHGAAYVFKWNGTSWDETKLTASGTAASEGFGSSVSVSGDGNIIAVGAPWRNFGTVFLYKWNGSIWESTEVTASDGTIGDEFGHSVALSPDGSAMVVGAAYKGLYGAAYQYNWNGSTWTETKLAFEDITMDDKFGHAVSVSRYGNVRVVSAFQNNGRGAVYVYK
jgi:hypothetical protein